jgi:eukaryotic-like serine/threonine-protein kinase
MPHSSAMRLQSLFSATLELPEADREPFMELQCQNDPAMLSELRALLEMDKDLANRTIRPIAPELSKMLSASAPAESMMGMRVGAFELRGELGRGGMGSVYRAERVDGSVSQQAAIKFVRRELLDANTLRRFQIERQTLAALDHPNIARLLDAGELDDGTPYFVMEYVAGVPITDYCAQANLDVRERVQLFRLVCAAVMQAHRSLVVHRDLKPSNILVNNDGVPKLLDFGIAKPLNADFNSAAEEQTGTAQRYFSPSYSAPEQLLGAAIGVGCDVYALGLLLYELLAETRPFDFTGLTAGQIERLVTTMPPDAPSIAASKTEATQALRRQLRGDLDGIVLRCLRKAPNERYASVEQLDADLGNYLEGRPVQARGGHGWYRTQKFLRRHLGAVAASAVTALALLIGIGAFAWQARIANLQTGIAQQRAAELEQVAQFQADMLGEFDPAKAGQMLTADVKAKFTGALTKSGNFDGEHSTRIAEFSNQWRMINATDAARDLIDRTVIQPAVKTIETEFSDQPMVNARLSQVLSEVYTQMGSYDAAQPLQDRALTLRKKLLPEGHADTLRSLLWAGILSLNRGRYQEAEQHWLEALALTRSSLGELHPDTINLINNMGLLKSEQGNRAEAEIYYREAMQKRIQIFGEEHLETAISFNNVSRILIAQEKFDEAMTLNRKALQIRRHKLGDDHPITWTSIKGIGMVYYGQGRWKDAEPYFTEVLEKRTRLLGQDHPNTLSSMGDMGKLLQAQGKFAEAETLVREALERSQRVLGEGHPSVFDSRIQLGDLLLAQARYTEAIETLARIEAPIRVSLRELGDALLCQFLTIYGSANTGLHNYAMAEDQLLEAHTVCSESSSTTRKEKLRYLNAVVALYAAWQHSDQSTDYETKASEWKRQVDTLEAAYPASAVPMVISPESK